MMKTKTYSISRVIDAEPETVFRAVADFSQYKNWNTFIPYAKGNLVVGTELQLTMKVNGKNTPFNPKVISVVLNKSFLLSKTIISKNIIELTHQFEFKPLPDHKTEFSQTWQGRGIIAVMLWGKIRKGCLSFEIFNEDLAQYIGTRNQNL